MIDDIEVSGGSDHHLTRDAGGLYPGSGAMYQDIIENADGVPFQLIFGAHPGEGYYLSIGAGITQLTGIPKEEFTEKVFLEMIEKIVPLSGSITGDLSESRERFLKGEVKSYKAEVLIRMPGGAEKWIQDSSLPLIDDETEKIIGASGILFDINERVLMMHRLDEARKIASESDKLKNSFLHNLSHEIRTPLNAIVGFSSLLNNPCDEKSAREEISRIILRSSDRLLEIFDNIIEMSNIEAGNVAMKMENVNINEVLRRIYENLRTTACEKNISLGFVTALDDNDARINTDCSKLEKIITNLTGNAMKFTAEGEVRFGYSVNKEMLEFFVSDTGIGIPAENHPMIFNSFYQADSGITRSYEGTGLGLSISKAYVTMLGGEIWFNSVQGKGSIFYFTLPYHLI